MMYTYIDGLSSAYSSERAELTSLVIVSSLNFRCIVVPGEAFIMYPAKNGLRARMTVRQPHPSQLEPSNETLTHFGVA